MEREKWRQLYAYWLSKHVDGRLPGRADIDPLPEIPRLVANLILLDVLPDGYRYRVVGTEVVFRSGHDRTGRALGSSGKEPGAVAAFRGYADWVVAERKPRLVLTRLDRTTVESVSLLLPLAASDGRIEMLLCGWFFKDERIPGGWTTGLSIVESELLYIPE